MFRVLFFCRKQVNYLVLFEIYCLFSDLIGGIFSRRMPWLVKNIFYLALLSTISKGLFGFMMRLGPANTALTRPVLSVLLSNCILCPTIVATLSSLCHVMPNFNFKLHIESRPSTFHTHINPRRSNLYKVVINLSNVEYA